MKKQLIKVRFFNCDRNVIEYKECVILGMPPAGCNEKNLVI